MLANQSRRSVIRDNVLELFEAQSSDGLCKASFCGRVSAALFSAQGGHLHQLW